MRSTILLLAAGHTFAAATFSQIPSRERLISLVFATIGEARQLRLSDADISFLAYKLSNSSVSRHETDLQEEIAANLRSLSPRLPLKTQQLVEAAEGAGSPDGEPHFSDQQISPSPESLPDGINGPSSTRSELSSSLYVLAENLEKMPADKIRTEGDKFLQKAKSLKSVDIRTSRLRFQAISLLAYGSPDEAITEAHSALLDFEYVIRSLPVILDENEYDGETEDSFSVESLSRMLALEFRSSAIGLRRLVTIRFDAIVREIDWIQDRHLRLVLRLALIDAF